MIPKEPLPEVGLAADSQEDLAAAFVGLDAHHAVDPETERRALRKLDLFFLPTMFCIYLLVYYDKAILASAALLGMTTDLELTVVLDPSTSPPTVSTARLSWAISLFYFGLLAGLFPMTLIVQRLSVGRVLGPCIIIWGAVAMSTAAVTTWQGLYAQRFFLGFMESVVPSSFAVIISCFYTQREQASRQACWLSATGFGAIIGGLISYGFANIKGGALARWRYLYLFAGALTILFGVFSFCIPDSPMDAWFLTHDERVAATERLRHGQTGVRNHKIKLQHIYDCLKDVKFWLVAVIMFLTYMANGAVTGFGPLIVNTFGWSTFESILLQFPLGFLAAAVTLATGFVALKVRHTMIAQLILSALLSIVGFIMIWKSAWYPRAALPVVGYTFMGFFSGCASLAVCVGMANVAGATKKSIMSATIFVAYSVGNIAGPFLVVSQTKGEHYPMLWTGLIACYCLLIFFAGCLALHLWRENKRRDRQGAAGLEKTSAETGFLDMTDSQNPHFRYAL